MRHKRRRRHGMTGILLCTREQLRRKKPLQASVMNEIYAQLDIPMDKLFSIYCSVITIPTKRKKLARNSNWSIYFSFAGLISVNIFDLTFYMETMQHRTNTMCPYVLKLFHIKLMSQFICRRFFTEIQLIIRAIQCPSAVRAYCFNYTEAKDVGKHLILWTLKVFFFFFSFLIYIQKEEEKYSCNVFCVVKYRFQYCFYFGFF